MRFAMNETIAFHWMDQATELTNRLSAYTAMTWLIYLAWGSVLRTNSANMIHLWW